MHVMIVYGAPDQRHLQQRCDHMEIAEADLIIGLNDEGSEGKILKSRYADVGQPVKVVS